MPIAIEKEAREGIETATDEVEVGIVEETTIITETVGSARGTRIKTIDDLIPVDLVDVMMREDPLITPTLMVRPRVENPRWKKESTCLYLISPHPSATANPFSEFLRAGSTLVHHRRLMHVRRTVQIPRQSL